MSNLIWEDENFYIEKHSSELPWLKLFLKEDYKEVSEIPFELKMHMYGLLEDIELALIDFYSPDKINIASFGNVLPKVHWHIIARFKNDPYFPKTTWEEPVREFNLELPDFNDFKLYLVRFLNN